MQWVDLLGYAASAMVLATFSVSTMVPLRILALFSNVLFVGYGYADGLYPVLVLHLVLFPVNLYRLIEMKRMIRDVERAATGDLSLKALLPLMSKARLPAGETLTQ